MSKETKLLIARLAVGTAAFVGAFLAPDDLWWLHFVPYLIIGGDVLYRAVSNILRGSVFDENFLMSIATIGAFVLGQYDEAVFVMLFYQVGELFQSIAVNRSRRSIADLLNIRPDFANIEQDGRLEKVDPEDVSVNDVIVVSPGERVPLDGVVISGLSDLDTSALTGESQPADAAEGSQVFAGAVNLTGVLRIKVTKPYDESTAARIIELVENASDKKAKTENFITRFARVYTPIVVLSALLLAVVPPLLIDGQWWQWLERGLIFLVVSCPCALVISVPLSFFGGIGGAARRGILVKGSNYLEALAKVDTVVFDKTGTLTTGKFSVSGVCPADGVTKERLLELAALSELYSHHPTAIAVKAAYPGKLSPDRVENSRELPGRGVSALIDGRELLVGNAALMAENGIEVIDPDSRFVELFVAENGSYAGKLSLSDSPKPGAAQAIAALHQKGVKQTVMLTGDKESVAEAIAKQVGIDQFHAKLLPQDKVAQVEKLLKASTGSLAFVGDGINDAPVLARADVGIAMGAIGSDAAIEAADIVLMDDDPRKLAAAIGIARKTMVIARENIIFAISVKLAVLVLAALGLAGMWLAVFADVGVAVLAILNALRAMKSK